MLRWSLVLFSLAIACAAAGFGGLVPSFALAFRLFFFAFSIGGTILLAWTMMRALDRQTPTIET